MSLCAATLITPPVPLHCSSWQSAGVCDVEGNGVPADVLLKPQTPLVQVRWAQNVLVPQSAATVQPTHCPDALQEPAAQGNPDETGTCVGVPAEQPSVVHSLKSSGTSRSSAMLVTPPAPSHTAWLQSPGDCARTGVPDCVGESEHAPPTHIRVPHSVVGGSELQSLSPLHSTHEPAASQKEPPLREHAVPMVTARVSGTPLLQIGVAHCPVGGKSVGSFWSRAAPAPSQTATLQSPDVWAAVTVPIGKALVPHTPPTQIGTSQALDGVGQSVTESQPPLPPLPPVLEVLVVPVPPLPPPPDVAPSGTQVRDVSSHT
jgi:hypothetical protein